MEVKDLNTAEFIQQIKEQVCKVCRDSTGYHITPNDFSVRFVHKKAGRMFHSPLDYIVCDAQIKSQLNIFNSLSFQVKIYDDELGEQFVAYFALKWEFKSGGSNSHDFETKEAEVKNGNFIIG